MSLQHCALAVAAGLLFAANANADIGVTADLGTTGAGVHIVVPMETYLNGRFGVNGYKRNFTTTSNSIDYAISGKLNTIDALFDWYLRPGSSFHLTGGIIYNNTRFDASAHANAQGKFVINGDEYEASDIGELTGSVNFRKAAPYLGIGWGNALARDQRWNFNVDLGAYYQGRPNVSLASEKCGTDIATCVEVAANVKEERARLAEDISSLKVYPVLRASVSYRF
ncbi:hypothetical protein [Massilia horti]|uniref:Histidine kinase n=1 Tax=Massilia horti TaxID=2562153 RepID=A0A4Y9SN27_9BURK|nr:hypothetical protein [Massilia horti]TFW27948.1 hypothetical protein E4O92_22545 [Massilia horti]